MGVVISRDMSLVALAAENPNDPLIGYHNLVTAANVSASSEAAGFPVENVANPATHQRWAAVDTSPASDVYLTVDVSTVEPIDYVAIARHNLGSAAIAISVEVLDTMSSPVEWVEVVADVLLPDDGPAILRFEPQAVSGLRVRLQAGLEAPTIAVLYVGALLRLQRRIYVGHKPVTLNRRTRVTNARSESGNFLGRIVMGQSTATEVRLQNLTPDWYRAAFHPFVVAAEEVPFFFAWRPGAYPYEVCYGWLTDDVEPVNQLANGMMEVSFSIGAILK